jgi:hypothetical protein
VGGAGISSEIFSTDLTFKLEPVELGRHQVGRQDGVTLRPLWRPSSAVPYDVGRT